MARTRPCTPETRKGRLRKSTQFLDAANILADLTVGEDDHADAYIALCIQAAIAAADVICCARLGQHAQGQDHGDAVTLLSQADSESAKHLRVLLGMKNKADYSHTPMSAAEVKRAGRAIEALTETARRVNAE